MKKTILILLLLIPIDTAFACQCVPLTFEQEVQLSNRIFRGRVIAVDNYQFDVEIIYIWEGEFASKTFRLIQGMTSCEKRTFDLNKEYLFYVKEKSVVNCSRTDEYELTMDPELLDLKFKNIGDKKSIESNSITDRELEILKLWLKNKNINPDDIVDQELLFGIQDKCVDKWTFFDAYRWSNEETKLINLETGKSSGSMLLWTGNNWTKAFKKLKKNTKLLQPPMTP